MRYGCNYKLYLKYYMNEVVMAMRYYCGNQSVRAILKGRRTGQPKITQLFP